jgi:hypothetical protein
VAATVVGGLILVRAIQPSPEPAPGAPPSTAVSIPPSGRDVVGTWVVTESNGFPRPAQLPTYHFKIGTGPGGIGVVTGFDGCGEVHGSWRLDGDRLIVDDDANGVAKPCPFLGETTPLVPLTGATLVAADGNLVLRLGDGGGSLARQTFGLASPPALRDTKWVLALDGPDLTLAFTADELTASVDGAVCARIRYRYDGASLLTSPSTNSAPGPCQRALLDGLHDVAFRVVQYTDRYSPSLLLTTLTAGTIRLYPASSVQAHVEASNPPRDTTASTASSGASAPAPTGSGRLASWTSPSIDVGPSVESVPMLLPAAALPGLTSAIRYEYADAAPPPAADHAFVQAWIDPDTDATLSIATHVGGQPPPSGTDEPVTVAGWDHGALTERAPGVTTVVVGDPGGSVTITGTRLEAAEVLAIAAGLTARADDQPGWLLAPPPAGLIPVVAGWTGAHAQRSVIWSRDDTPVIELSITTEAPELIADHAATAGAAVTLTDVDGAPAVGTEVAGTASVAWLSAPDVTVRLGVRSTLDAALAIARSVTPVDGATWQATTTPSTHDGCNGLFC